MTSRIGRQLPLLFVCFWCVFAWASFARDNRTPGTLDREGHIKGQDFAQFYVLGQIAAEHASNDLYRFDAIGARLDRLVPQYEVRFPPVHPPQVALFFAPFAHVPYLEALAIWLCLSAVLYGICCWLMWKTVPAVRKLGWFPAIALCVGFPAFHSVIAIGQVSVWALLWFTLGWLAFRRERWFLGGLMLGCLAYKPTLLIVAPLAFMFARQWRVTAGIAVAAIAQFAIAWLRFGGAVFKAFIDNSASLRAHMDWLESQPWQMHSLRSFFALLVPSVTLTWILYALTAAVIMIAAVRAWRSQAPLGLRYGVLILGTVLIDPHVYSYELVVLAAAFFLVTAWMIEQPDLNPRLSLLLRASFYLPAFDSLTRFTHVQLSVPVFFALTLWLAALAARSKAL